MRRVVKQAARLSRQVGRSLRRQTLERLLERYDAQLAACKRTLRDEVPAAGADVKDEMDDGFDHLARAVGVALLEASASTVRGIENALNRLKRGTYGTCADCGNKIPAIRLRVLPFAERCRDCQQECDSLAQLPWTVVGP